MNDSSEATLCERATGDDSKGAGPGPAKECVAERCRFAVGDRIDGRWLVEGFLGEGTFGKVFRVSDSGSGAYALKLLKLWEVMACDRSGLLSRFDREYETGLIDSDYLVRSLHKGKVKGNAYIVMEYCAGGDLSTALRKSHLDMALIGQQVLLGLRDLHVNGKVHRDLKPENVLLRSATRVVLTDFGIAGDRNNRLTQRGWRGVPQERFGTIAYMPPEQLNPKRGNATVLPTTDIFSYGVMMYQLLTGRLPFGRLDSDSDVPAYVNNGSKGAWDRDALLAANGGGAWLSVVEGCLAPDFRTRLQTIDDVLPLLPPPATPVAATRPLTRSRTMPFKQSVGRGLVLRVMQGEEPGRAYAVSDLMGDNAQVVTIGRVHDEVWNHIGIKEEESSYISRQHCTMEYEPASGTWLLRDGQYRVQCSIALRSHQAYPCAQCTAACGFIHPPVRWKESLNGTYVNSREVTSAGMAVHPGDIISIGDVKLRVEGA